jgi:benzoate-CoA ligase
MNTAQSSAAPKGEASGTAAVPRDYNFAADILKRNLDAGRGDKIAFIDHRGKYSYADLADRVERFGHVIPSIGRRPSSAPSRPAWSPFRSIR